jgi:hypothetical protein
MPSVTVDTRISARAEEVWNHLCKINRYAKWDAFADEIISASHSRLKAGSTFVERSGMERSEWRVTSFDAPRRQVHAGRVGFMGEVTREFIVEPAGDEAAVLRQTISFKIMPGLTRPFGWLGERLYVNRMVRNRLTQSGEAAKAMLEGGEG